MEKNIIKISVRSLIEFVMRSGDLDNRFTGNSRAVEGIKAHQKIQKEKEKKYKDKGNVTYKSEYFLASVKEYKEFIFKIEGRIDGILNEKGIVTIEEIKSTYKALEDIDEFYNELHWAQAKIYAYMYCTENNFEYIEINLIYYNIEEEKIKELRKNFKVKELEDFFYEVLDKYIIWAQYTADWVKMRNHSIGQLEFPFNKYRKGQRELAIAVYKTINLSKKIFISAPTGIGKTISTIFPTVKAMGEEKISKIFYLTAKTVTRKVATSSIEKMRKNDLKIKSLTLTAKDKICFNKEGNCNPEECKYAKGHFDRVNNALYELLNKEDNIDREVIEKYSYIYNICPFEFSLDISEWVDIVICDYNYVFDPRVSLKRFFTEEKGDFMFLIDEGHNLVDRAREMYSASLSKKEVMELKKIMKGKNKKIYSCLNNINKYFINIKNKIEEESLVKDKESPKELYSLIRIFVREAEEYLKLYKKSEGYEELLNFYFSSNNFLKISELYDDNYVTYFTKEENNVIVKLFCLNPSKNLKEVFKKGRAAVVFSATLSPIAYFKDILGGEEEDYNIKLASPFDKEKLCVINCTEVSTKYKDRENNIDKVVEYIYNATNERLGNYFTFFPSYIFMQRVYERFKSMYPEVSTIIQEQDMKEENREAFLESFKENPKETLVGFALLGGIFSEGIDLKGDKLIGAIIVGVGLPQVCKEREIISQFFQEKNKDGFSYSYVYPGINKVLQASGRVIRTEEDKGIIILLDERFNNKFYRALLPEEWSGIKNSNNINIFKETLKKFWTENNY